MKELAYSTKCKGIGGKIKQRIADFIVEEISQNGERCGARAFSEKEKLELEKFWPEKEEGKDYLIMEMEKFNYDTFNAVRLVARVMGFSRKRIGFAGLKDKRAITSQRISIWKPEIARLKEFKSRYIDLRALCWGSERTDIGMLWGNSFKLTIRGIELEEKELRERVEEFFSEAGKGIANYFGEQRFGFRNITQLVGEKILKGNLEEAVMLYLSCCGEKEEVEVQEIRKELAEKKDFSLALKRLPKKHRFERILLNHLCRYEKDFAGALRKPPKSLVYLFSHAYQSELFNKVLEKRILEGIGLQPVEGDLLEEGIPTAPLFGFESGLAIGKPGEIEKQVLEEAGIELRFFKSKSLPEASSKGMRRKIAVFPKNMKLFSVSEDELNEGKLKAVVGFELEKGSYATSVLRELMKNSETF